jgi:hypothetical protein
MRNNESDIYGEARRRVREKAKFYKHLYFFLIFNGILFVMALFRGRPFMPLTIALFWGIGVVFHYLKVFGLPGSGILSKEWEDRELHKEINRLKGNKPESNTADSLDEKMELKELRKNYDETDLV